MRLLCLVDRCTARCRDCEGCQLHHERRPSRQPRKSLSQDQPMSNYKKQKREYRRGRLVTSRGILPKLFHPSTFDDDLRLGQRKYPSNWPYTHPLPTQYRISESFSLEDDRWTSLPQSWVRATALAGNLVAYLQVRLRTNVKLPCKEGASAASTTKFFNALASDSDQARFTFSPLLPSTLITFPDQESDS